MKTCDRPGCVNAAVSLLAALRLGWAFSRGYLYCKDHKPS